MEREQGLITSIQLSFGHGVPMREVDAAELKPDYGIEGDRHARPKSRRQILLVEAETLEALGLEPGQVREQITTRNVDLNSLPRDSRLLLGPDVELWVTGPCHPCRLMDDIRDGLQEELRGRRGTLAWVKSGGRIRIGDALRVMTPPGDKEMHG